jgi:signal transduction histidine kinase
MVEVEFETRPRKFANANKDQIIQVIQNIWDNAIKFFRLRRQAAYLHPFRIKDRRLCEHKQHREPNPPSDIPYLFDRFYKGDESHTRVKEGTGIGLSW